MLLYSYIDPCEYLINLVEPIALLNQLILINYTIPRNLCRGGLESCQRAQEFVHQKNLESFESLCVISFVSRGNCPLLTIHAKRWLSPGYFR